MIGAGLIAGIVIVGAMMIFGKGVGEKLKYGCLFFILVLIVLGLVAVSLLQGL
ncbi:hypothetical protein [Paenibacillus chungangensis]|uniref:DUF1328 domain-containing protein n=1 Tax=Paenibacillus chungangensis TaxID=696535 RepID=A0ABW3HKF5_9BACL